MTIKPKFRFTYQGTSGAVFGAPGAEFVQWGGMGFEIDAASSALRVAIEARRPR